MKTMVTPLTTRQVTYNKGRMFENVEIDVRFVGSYNNAFRFYRNFYTATPTTGYRSPRHISYHRTVQDAVDTLLEIDFNDVSVHRQSRDCHQITKRGTSTVLLSPRFARPRAMLPLLREVLILCGHVNSPSWPALTCSGLRVMSRVEDVFQLAQWMRASRFGVSIADIQERFRVSRRTAERLRNDVAYLFPDMEEVETDGPTKRWRLPVRELIESEGYSTDELAALSKAADLLEHQNLGADADRVRNVQDKAAARISDATFSRMEPDLEALLQAEGFISRPGPKPIVDPNTLAELRTALKAMKRVWIDYSLRTKDKRTWIELSPYGLLYGHRHYLLGRPEGLEDPGVRLYSLPNIHAIRQTDSPIILDEAFIFDSFVKRAFGVYQEEPQDIVWKFHSDVADEVRSYRFHPTQEMIEQNDGGILVKFTACGELEMCWHLFTWGDQVEIVETKSLRERYFQELEKAIKRMKRKDQP